MEGHRAAGNQIQAPDAGTPLQCCPGVGPAAVQLPGESSGVPCCTDASLPECLGGGILLSPAFPQKASEWCVSTKGERWAPRSLLTLCCPISARHGWMHAWLWGLHPPAKHPSCKEPAGGACRWWCSSNLHSQLMTTAGCTASKPRTEGGI